MALSAEARSELLKNVSNFRLDLIKRLVSGSLIVKGYEDGKTELHVHAVVRVPTDSKAISGSNGSLICAVLQRKDSRTGTVLADDEMSMFVWIRDGLKALRPVRSLVRLIPLDYCRMFPINPVEVASAPLLLWGQPSPEDIWAVVDRELSAMLLNAGIEPRQLVDEIVERAPKGLDEFADQDANPGRNLALGCTIAERRGIAGTRIEVKGTNHGVDFCIDQRGADFLKIRQVFFCPIKPCISTFQVTHDAYSRHGQGEDPQAEDPERRRDIHAQALGLHAQLEESSQGQPLPLAPPTPSTSPLEHLF